MQDQSPTPRLHDRTSGSPYAPHTEAETKAMLDEVGVESEADLFDIPDPVRFQDTFGIPSRSEAAVREAVADLLDANDDLTELLGRGHHAHYVPSLVDHLSQRSEFLTSYTQYQPEMTQGFLQVLFEYQSLLVELTGLDVANCSMYDAATALGEAATLAHRVRDATGTRVLVPEHLTDGRRAVLENYLYGTDLEVESYAMDDGNASIMALDRAFDDDVLFLYAENPTVRGCVEEGLADLGDLAHDHDALFCVGSDPVSLALLCEPASVGADVVVGPADVLGLGTSFGMGLGLFAARESYLRQVPGRLVGASEDATGRRAFTLTLQTREQHIRRERATSNICTNQAWVALRAAIHAAWLGPSGMLDLAESAARHAAEMAATLDDLDGVTAPVHDRHHVGEFVCRTDRPAVEVAADLGAAGFAVHTIGDHELQVRVAGVPAAALDEFVAALGEVAA